MAMQAGPYKVAAANRMDDDQGKRLVVRLEKPGAMIGTIQQPASYLDLEFPYATDDDVKGIVRGVWIVLPGPTLTAAPGA